MNENWISCIGSCLIFQTILWKEVYYSHTTEEEINSELLGNNLRSQNLEVAENRFEYNSSNPKYVSFMLSLSLILKGTTIISVVILFGTKTH